MKVVSVANSIFIRLMTIVMACIEEIIEKKMIIIIIKIVYI